MENNELKHHGVVGMKWGVRRAKRQSSQSDDYKQSRSIMKKKIEEMSNADLKAVNNRLNLEANYREVSKRNVSAGRKWVTGILVGAATAVAATYAQQYAKQGADALLKGGLKLLKNNRK